MRINEGNFIHFFNSRLSLGTYTFAPDDEAPRFMWRFIREDYDEGPLGWNIYLILFGRAFTVDWL